MTLDPSIMAVAAMKILITFEGMHLVIGFGYYSI